LKSSTTSILTISSLELWISGKKSIYSEVPEVFATSNEVPRTSSPRLPPLAPPLLRPLLFCRQCQRRFPSHVPSLGRSPAPPPAPSYSTRHLDAGRCPSSSSLELSRARHANPSAARPSPRSALMPALLFSFCCPVALVDCTPSICLYFSCHVPPEPKHHCRFLPQLRRPPARRGQPTPVHPAPLRPPRKLPLTSLMLPSHSPWPDLRRSYLAVDLLLAGKLVSPSSPYLRPSSVQIDHPKSFSSSCCSYQARAWPSSSPGTSSPTSSPPPPPRPLWEPHLRPSPLPPKATHGCTMSSWCP
jgi:hypothetical protein